MFTLKLKSSLQKKTKLYFLIHVVTVNNKDPYNTKITVRMCTCTCYTFINFFQIQRRNLLCWQFTLFLICLNFYVIVGSRVDKSSGSVERFRSVQPRVPPIQRQLEDLSEDVIVRRKQLLNQEVRRLKPRNLQKYLYQSDVVLGSTAARNEYDSPRGRSDTSPHARDEAAADNFQTNSRTTGRSYMTFHENQPPQSVDVVDENHSDSEEGVQMTNRQKQESLETEQRQGEGGKSGYGVFAEDWHYPDVLDIAASKGPGFTGFFRHANDGDRIQSGSAMEQKSLVPSYNGAQINQQYYVSQMPGIHAKELHNEVPISQDRSPVPVNKQHNEQPFRSQPPVSSPENVFSQQVNRVQVNHQGNANKLFGAIQYLKSDEVHAAPLGNSPQYYSNENVALNDPQTFHDVAVSFLNESSRQSSSHSEHLSLGRSPVVVQPQPAVSSRSSSEVRASTARQSPSTASTTTPRPTEVTPNAQFYFNPSGTIRKGCPPP